MIRFVHAADLHLGKPFGSFPEQVRQLLKQSGRDVIGALGFRRFGRGSLSDLVSRLNNCLLKEFRDGI